jgi:fumarate reductase flavoprotein subunit
MTEPNNKYDLIIIGGGIAGLTAGVRAAEFGLRPLVLEQGEGIAYPNNSRQSGGILHIGFRDPFREEQDLEQHIARVSGNEAKPELARALAQTGARLITWLQGKGAKFMRFNPQEGYRWCMAPPRALKAGLDWKERGPDLILRRLALELVERGGSLQLGARATALILEQGRCVGVQGSCLGEQRTWHAPYCLIADGGFQANRTLFERHIGAPFDSVFQRGARTGLGDGLTMALAAGAVLTPGNRFYGHVLCSDAKHNDQVWPYPEVDAIATAGIVIDSTGKRFVDEGRSGVHLANELAAHAKTDKLFAVFDRAIWEGPGTSARIPANPLLERAGGTILRAENAVALAEKMGVPSDAFLETLAQYNEALADGTLQTLAISRSVKVSPMPIVQAPLMAIPICPGITYTMVGIDIDAQAQVLDSNATPIPGLFAAGATTGGLEGGRDSAYIGGLIKSGSFGLLAAERIAALEGKSVLIEQPKSTTTDATTFMTKPTIDSAENAVQGLARFPILRGTIRFGKVVAVGLSLVVALLIYTLSSASLGSLSVLLALGAGLLVLVIVLGFVELIKLITEFLIPE